MALPILLLANLAFAEFADSVAFFEKNIRPLLVKRCYECHSPQADKLRGNLYLHSRQGWQHGGDSGPAIVPGEPDKSLLIEAVRYRDEDFRMPPKGKLSPKEIALLELWVASGAVDPRDETTPQLTRPASGVAAARQSWPYTPIEAAPAPGVQNKSWPRDDIDRFVLAKLEAAGQPPVADAGPHAMIRRLYIDLIGLPPSLAEIATFEEQWQHDARKALESTVDTLLASPRFGERWGRHWLDLARYADTNGSDFNATFHNAWKYRDYVIEAFNRDLSVDRFIIEQLAGDLLPGDNPEEEARQIIATGFLMLGAKMLSERDKEKLQMDVVDEQLDTIGKVFMGLSLGCARCHNHKFDPVPQRDYYALAGIFASTETVTGEIIQFVSSWVKRELPLPDEHRSARESHQSRLKELEAQLKAAKGAAGKKPAMYPGTLVDNSKASLKGNWKSSVFRPAHVGENYLHDQKLDKGAKSATYEATLQAGEYEVRVSYPGGGGLATKAPITVHHADGVSEHLIDQSKTAPIGGLFEALGRYRFVAETPAMVVISNANTVEHVVADAVLFVPIDRVDEAPQGDVESKESIAALEKEVKAHKEKAPPPPPRAISVRESGTIGDTRLRIRGEARRHGDVVPRGFLRVCSSEDAAARLPRQEASGRLEFARWLASPEHPLTTRVFVNRVWQHMMGEGIVRSVDNFGNLGEPPTHEALLDTLAADFANAGWSVKQLVRRLALTRTYGLSTAHDAANAAKDPENRLLWRAHRKRLSAEAVRDSMLALAGKLDLSPSVNPVGNFKELAVDNGSGNWSGKIDEDLKYKRSVYQPIVRGDLPELLATFDFANPDMVTGRRPQTVVPSRSLLMLNSKDVHSYAAEIANSLMTAPEDARVEQAYRLLLARPPRADEASWINDYLGESTNKLSWTKVVQAILASTEFAMLD